MDLDVWAVLHEADQSISQALATFKGLREPLKWIEWSLHGIPWLAGSSLLLLTAYGKRWDQVVQYRLAILTTGLVVDLMVTGVLKLSVQRPRPPDNEDDMIYEAPIADQYSFPSGHTSRAALLATLWCSIYPRHSLAISAVPLAVAVSRVVMGRHYVSDALAGLLLGYLQGKTVLLLPMSYNSWLRGLLR